MRYSKARWPQVPPALLLPQGDDLAARLQPLLAELATNPGKRLAMAKAARALAKPAAASDVADAVLATIRKEAA